MVQLAVLAGAASVSCMDGASWSQHEEGRRSSSTAKGTANCLCQATKWRNHIHICHVAVLLVSNHHRGKRTGKETPSPTAAGSCIRKFKSVTVILVPMWESVTGGVWRILLPRVGLLSQGSGSSLAPTVLLAELEEETTIPGHPGGSDSVPVCVCPASNALL